MEDQYGRGRSQGAAEAKTDTATKKKKIAKNQKQRGRDESACVHWRTHSLSLNRPAAEVPRAGQLAPELSPHSPTARPFGPHDRRRIRMAPAPSRAPQGRPSAKNAVLPRISAQARHGEVYLWRHSRAASTVRRHRQDS